MILRLECKRGLSSKFWEADAEGDGPPFIVVVRWGRIGTEGQRQQKTFPTDRDRVAFVRDKLEEKVSRGYEEVKPAVRVRSRVASHLHDFMEITAYQDKTPRYVCRVCGVEGAAPSLPLGTRVRTLRVFAALPAGTEGVVDEDYGTGLMIAWDLPRGILPAGYARYDGVPGARSRIIRDGFDKATELQYLEVVSPTSPGGRFATIPESRPLSIKARAYADARVKRGRQDEEFVPAERIIRLED
jgi:predicted DNA-binding WGR domain protein